jgi:hypothetical protein
VVQDFGMELGDIVLFLKLLLWVKLGTSNLESCLHHDLWVVSSFYNVFWLFSLKLIGSFAMTFGGGLTLSQIVHKAFDTRRLESWFCTQIIHLSTHISFCQIEMTSVMQYSILWI